MKRKTVIIILTVQTALMLYSFIYAFVQEGIAKEQEMLAKENARRAMESSQLANEIRGNCENKFENTFNRIKELEAELSKCKKK